MEKGCFFCLLHFLNTTIKWCFSKIATYVRIFVLGLTFSLLLLASSILSAQNSANDTMLFQLKQTLNQVKAQENLPKIVAAHLQLGNYYFQLGVLEESMEQFYQASLHLDENTDDSLKFALNKGIGGVYLALKDFVAAHPYYEKAVNNATAAKNPKNKAIALGHLGTVLEKQGDYNQALIYQKESLSILTSLNDSIGISLINENIGSIYEDLLQWELSLKHFRIAYDYVGPKAYKAQTNILNNIGDIYRKQGLYEAGKNYTNEARNKAEMTNDLSLLESASKDLSETYALLGKHQLAYQYLLEAEKYKEMLLRKQHNSQVTNLQAVYESNQKEVKIRLLEEQHKLDETNQKFWLLGLLSFVVLLSTFFYAIGRRRQLSLKVKEMEQRELEIELEKKAIEEKQLKQEIQVKTASLSGYSLQIAKKNKLLFSLSNKLKNIAARKNIDKSSLIKAVVKEIDFVLEQENEWEEFVLYFKEINPEFIHKINALAKDKLSVAELRLAILLRLNLSSKEIASTLRIATDSVRVARYRLRKKLPIDAKENLVNFLLKI